jgi:hypothetical protein
MDTVSAQSVQRCIVFVFVILLHEPTWSIGGLPDYSEIRFL